METIQCMRTSLFVYTPPVKPAYNTTINSQRLPSVTQKHDLQKMDTLIEQHEVLKVVSLAYTSWRKSEEDSIKNYLREYILNNTKLSQSDKIYLTRFNPQTIQSWETLIDILMYKIKGRVADA